jgi:hypothetical protein
MLLSFRFANHKSFRDEQQLNLTPVYDSTGGADEDPPLEAVPVVGVFGANASGKSNVISAFAYFSSMVGGSDRESEPGQGPRRYPFRLDPDVTVKPSYFAADLLLDGVQYTYGFAVDGDSVTEEWLYAYPRQRQRVVFERSGQDFKWGEESRRSRVRELADIVAPAALFLSVSARFDPRSHAGGSTDAASAVLHDVFTWLWQKVVHDRPLAGAGSKVRIERYVEWLADPARRMALVNLLRNADVGLLDISAALPESSPEGIYRNYGNVKFVHQGSTDDVAFGYTNESAGTLRLLELAAQVIPVLNNGGLFLVDEIDASLHPLLTAHIVHLFQRPSSNKGSGQLIFTSHDATLLGSLDGEDILQRDQVWFTEKDDDGASSLYALAEFKPRRQGENRQKRYLNGIYGAIPELSMRLFEQAIGARVDSSAE